MEPSPKKYNTDAANDSTSDQIQYPTQQSAKRKQGPMFFRSVRFVSLVDARIVFLCDGDSETGKRGKQAMSDVELGGEMGIYQNVAFDENTKKVVGFREPDRRFET